MPRFSCCGATFEGEQSYLEHRHLVHGERGEVKHTCCGLQFSTDEGYAEHRLTVHGEGQASGATVAVAVQEIGRKSPNIARKKVRYLARCKVCRTPIRGLRSLPYRLRGIIPYAKNPQLCNR